jgi:hypothetical protein
MLLFHWKKMVHPNFEYAQPLYVFIASLSLKSNNPYQPKAKRKKRT